MVEKWFGNKKNGVFVKIFEDTKGFMSGLQIETYFDDIRVGDIELRNEELRDVAKFISEELSKQTAKKKGGDLNE